MSLPPWRTVIEPHPDVLRGNVQQAEFAADLTTVQKGTAPPEYLDAVQFFERTYITDGMGRLLTAVAQRLNGRGGDPVVQLQTSFGGGKTHTLLAVYHLATRTQALSELSGVSAWLDRAGLLDVPRARVAVLDGNALSPGQPWKRGRTAIRTLWGDLAWQLGGRDGYDTVAASEEAGTSPGKELLVALLSRAAPCVILADELVAFVRQLRSAPTASAGSYDANLSFFQALTEAVKQVPSAVLLASLPESEAEAGSAQAVEALHALSKVFGRVHAVWKPVEAEESFEIVRRRLFRPIAQPAARDEVCRAYAQLYQDEPARFPSACAEGGYLERLRDAYPIHPEVFDRLYGDWSTLAQFQRTRGVLKLMAQVIHALWDADDRDALIQPASFPLGRGTPRNELLQLLPKGWDAVVDRDIDHTDAEAALLERREPRFGAVRAGVRVARTVFLGSAPSSAQPRAVNRGVDRARVMLGCVRPGESLSVYSDALNRLCDRAHYLNTSDDKARETARFWFDVRANLRREMEDRRGRFDAEITGTVAELLGRMLSRGELFGAFHIFTDPADVRDDEELRLVVLEPAAAWSAAEPGPATDAALRCVRDCGQRPRSRANRLLFLAADRGSLERMRDNVRTWLAWRSIVEDIRAARLVIDQIQSRQADNELATAEQVARKTVSDTYSWLLCPTQDSPQLAPTVEAHRVRSTGTSVMAEVERVCLDQDLVIRTWAPTHLASLLRAWYWRPGAPAVKALTVWEDTARTLYMPRLRARAVFEDTLRRGAASADFFATAGGQEAERLLGLSLGGAELRLDDALLLVEPGYARGLREAERAEAERAAAERAAAEPLFRGGGEREEPSPRGGVQARALFGAPEPGGLAGRSAAGARGPGRFTGIADVHPATAVLELTRLAEELIALLARDPKARVKVTLEVNAAFPEGASEALRRAVTENAQVLGLGVKEWE